MEVKELAPHPVSGSHHRGLFITPLFTISLETPFCRIGYSAPGREKVYHLKFDGDDSDVQESVGKINTKVEVQKDIKESFEVGREDDPIMPNIWYPDGVLPGFKEACLDFFWVSQFKTGFKGSGPAKILIYIVHSFNRLAMIRRKKF